MYRVKNKTKPIKNGIVVPKYIIIIGKILQFINFYLATKYAVFLFKLPIKFKPPEREKIMSKSAQNEFVYIPSIKKKIHLYKYGYSNRKVLLVHGWSGRGTQMYKIADKLLEHGFMTYSFDAPAHGKSEGKTTMMPDFIETIKHIHKKFGPFDVAIGHSLGGMSVLNAVKSGVNFNKVVSISAGDIITDIITNFTKQMKFKPEMVKSMENYYLKE
ncbi:MAG TPA: alpha/beta hydrolase, partial [Flavobacteriaceae bacterium]|nr:alpha/beta hydrolase [Flavobacteriaceae bacterium]